MSGLRHRNVQESTPLEEDPAEKYLKPLRKLDVFPKQAEDVVVKTQSGGLITAIVGVVIMILFIYEFGVYWSDERKEVMGVDTTTGGHMPISLDIMFYDVDCDILECHEIDNAEQREHSIDRYVSKVRIDTDTGTELNPWARRGYCGPCRPQSRFSMGNVFTKGQCCNTCDQVRKYITLHKESYEASSMPQCKAEALQRTPGRKQGCRVQGVLDVPKLAGNFHFGLMNTSHHINYIRIGQYHSSIHNPLEHRHEIVKDGNVFFRYFLKIVPTTVVDKSGTEFNTYQYSATHARQVERFRRARKNGVFFVYDLSPFSVRYTTSSRSLLHFLTNVCAIIGGVFTVAGLTDKLIYKSFSKYLGTSPTLGID